jgi:hypothetical protein
MKILSGHWYGWQTMPGKDGAPDFAPIRICAAQIDQLDRTVIELTFLTLGYRQGARQKRLRILQPTQEYLVATFDTGTGAARTAIISDLNRAWLGRCCPTIAVELGSSITRLGLQLALDTILTAH